MPVMAVYAEQQNRRVVWVWRVLVVEMQAQELVGGVDSRGLHFLPLLPGTASGLHGAVMSLRREQECDSMHATLCSGQQPPSRA